MTPDIEKYRRYVDHFDISETEKIEFIHAIWHIGQNFMDRAFNADPVQLALRDQNAKRASSEKPMLDFEKAANGSFVDITPTPTKERRYD